MDEQELSKLLKRVWAQRLTVDEAMRELKAAPYEQLKHARVDHHRSIRWGFPEVIYCEGKSPQDITEIARAILQRSSRLLATRASAVAYAAVQEADANAIYHDVARCITVTRSPPEAQPGRVVVICAGTADIPVAEEARITASMLGFDVETVYDAGVAGIHRLLVETSKIQSADAIVVVAGMEGALASVVGGLAEAPVIAVPTSVGYGASFGGLAPLLTMLNSCAAGVAVVNIDNGFGAGYLAATIARRKHRHDDEKSQRPTKQPES